MGKNNDIANANLKTKKIPTPNFDRIDPRTCVNGKLRRLHRLINSIYQSKLHVFGINGSILSILFIIGKKKHVNQKTLADILVLDQSTMSRDIKKLVKKGWVQVNKGTDSRHSQLELTNKGYEFLEEVVPVWEAVHHKVEKLLGEYSVMHVDVLIEAIRSNMEMLKE